MVHLRASTGCRGSVTHGSVYAAPGSAALTALLGGRTPQIVVLSRNPGFDWLVQQRVPHCRPIVGHRGLWIFTLHSIEDWWLRLSLPPRHGRLGVHEHAHVDSRPARNSETFWPAGLVLGMIWPAHLGWFYCLCLHFYWCEASSFLFS